MKVQLEPGKYVVAVSGGVDSMSLLHALKDLPDVELVVAHFDHGIRPDSAQDRELVQKIADEYGLSFEYTQGHLGKDASEEQARKARYEFLEQVKTRHNAAAIVTAHHADDLLETAILNMLRGTGRKGLTSLNNRPGFVRPLLGISKAEITEYARVNKLKWREDTTNQDVRYARNYVRHYILPQFGDSQKKRLQEILHAMNDVNIQLDVELQKVLAPYLGTDEMDRDYIAHLPHDVAKEVIATWLRGHNLREFDRKTLERVVVGAKTGRPGSSINVYGSYIIKLDKRAMQLVDSSPQKH